MGHTMTKDLIQPHVKLFDFKENREDADVLILFGTEEDSLIRSTLSWMKKGEGRFSVFIETSEEQFLKAGQLPFVKDPHVRLFFWKEGDASVFLQIAWEFLFLRFGYLVSRSSSEPAAQEFFGQLEHYHHSVDHLASDCEDMGLKVLSNAFHNLPFLSRSCLGPSLEGKCAGMTAVICGAGPSLNSALPHLKSLKEKVLLIAGGTAVRVLNSYGIEPHLCASIDPEPPKERFREQSSMETPFFYQGRFSHTLLKTVHGPLVWMPDSGSYPLEAWMAAECGVFAEPFDAGSTVSNFCTSLAAHLGCTTLVFAGMDFSCGPKEIYAGDIEGKEHGNSLIELKKDQLYSRRDWLLSAAWMGSFARRHPQIRCINASSGIPLPGMEQTPFSEVETLLLLQQTQIPGRLHCALMESTRTNVPLEKVADVIDKVKKSFEKCHALCGALLRVWEKHYPKSPLETGEYALLDHDLHQEVGYTHFLVPLWNVWKGPILRTSFHPLGQHIHRLLFFKNALEKHLNSGAFKFNVLRADP